MGTETNFLLPWRRLMAVFALAAMVATGCGSSGTKTTGASPTTAKATGKALTVGTSADFPPLSSKSAASGQIVGFENDMLTHLLGATGHPFSWSQLEFNGLIPALTAGRIDMISSGMYDTAARAKVVDFVDYMKVPLAVITQKSDAASVKDYTGLCGHSVAYIIGSPPELTQLQQWSQQCTAAGKAAITAQGYQGVAAAVTDITNGRTFAELEGDIVVIYVSNTQFGSKLGVAFNVEGGTSTVGLAFPKGSSLLPTVRDAMASYIASPAYCTDAKTWSLTPGDLLRTCP
ncbi:MAG TPA: ABC transporter substrate-binding protein [Acidimicrobiales bacterium]|jgi:polar amino acid transport system substrate-binding protein|nr:ABC transporter substrate-binding protein [Acidimicrobiales bacterium]